MKIWTSEHTFQHPWETVVQAAWRKYPNPLTPNVTAVDVVERSVDKSTGVLHSERLMRTEWGLAKWVINLVGLDRPCYVREHSEVNPVQKTMTLKAKNLTFCNFVGINEQLVYAPHPDNPDQTLLKQEAVITVDNVPLTSYMESIIANTCSSNANKGREAMEWVIDHIKTEAEDLKRKAIGAVDSIENTFKNEADDLRKKTAGFAANIDNVLSSNSKRL